MKDHHQIFASPPEPFFNMKGSCLARDMLSDLLKVQFESNRCSLELDGSNAKYFKDSKFAECIFSLCAAFEQPSETRYLALEILDRFLSEKITSSFKTVQSNHQNSNSQRVKEWKISMEELSNNSVYYILICVQIGSKLCSHQKVITNRKAASFLNNAGFHINHRDLLDYELEVLKTINFELNLTSPLTYVETILEFIGHEGPVSVKVLHDVSLRIMDLVSMERSQIYDRLFSITTGDKSRNPKLRHKFRIVENDVVLLAASVIGAASYITGKSTSDKVIQHLEEITSVPGSDIVDFSTVIIENILQHAIP